MSKLILKKLIDISLICLLLGTSSVATAALLEYCPPPPQVKDPPCPSYPLTKPPCPPPPCQTKEQRMYAQNWFCNFWDDLKRDCKMYVQPNNILQLGETFVVAGILANTRLDRWFWDQWQTYYKSRFVDDVLHLPKTVADVAIIDTLIFTGAVVLGHYRSHTVMGNVLYTWGYRSIRTAIIGGVQQGFFTVALGGGRPCKHQDSKWQPFRYNASVSGHAFYGAVPFITAAMITEPPLLRYGLYFISILPGVARINSGSHYLSQVILGWTFAYLSARSVYNSDLEKSELFYFRAYPRSDGIMLSAQLQF